jgi:fermentation-respiration switch protein FrsA (DUF1100 family)
MRRLAELARKLWSSRHPGWTLLRGGVLFATCSVVGLMLFEEKLIFYPDRYPLGDWAPATPEPAPGDLAAAVQDVSFTAADGVSLHGWYCSPLRGAAAGPQEVELNTVLLWCHGNAGNITHRIDKIRRFCEAGLHVFIFDYRGYGKSEGSPSEAGMYSDTAAAWRHLTVTRGIAADRIILYGVSLGGAAAIELAATVAPAGLIAESTFTCAADMGRIMFPFVPACLIRSEFDSLRTIPAVACPKLFIHGTRDEIIPYHMGLELHAAARGTKTFYEVSGAGHNDLYLVGGEQYLEMISRFIATATPAAIDTNAPVADQ